MYMKKIFLLIFSLATVAVVSAQQKDTVNFQRPTTSSNHLHMNLIMNIGGGFKQLNTGIITEDGQTVKISPGGGTGVGLQVGLMMLESNWDFSVGAYMQWSSMSPRISNGDGSFYRTLIEPTIKYVITFKDKNKSINLGAGLLMSVNGELDIDASQIPQ